MEAYLLLETLIQAYRYHILAGESVTGTLKFNSVFSVDRLEGLEILGLVEKVDGFNFRLTSTGIVVAENIVLKEAKNATANFI